MESATGRSHSNETASAKYTKESKQSTDVVLSASAVVRVSKRALSWSTGAQGRLFTVDLVSFTATMFVGTKDIWAMKLPAAYTMQACSITVSMEMRPSSWQSSLFHDPSIMARHRLCRLCSSIQSGKLSTISHTVIDYF